MLATTLPQSTTPAIVSSFMQFCSETIKPFGEKVLGDHDGCPFSIV